MCGVCCVSQITVSLRRQTPTVHLAGSFILICVLRVVQASEQQERRDNVLTLVLLTPAALLSSGIQWDGQAYTAGLMVLVVHVSLVLPSHSLKSSDDVTLTQVHDVITCCRKLKIVDYTNYFTSDTLIRLCLVSLFNFCSSLLFVAITFKAPIVSITTKHLSDPFGIKLLFAL